MLEFSKRIFMSKSGIYLFSIVLLVLLFTETGYATRIDVPSPSIKIEMWYETNTIKLNGDLETKIFLQIRVPFELTNESYPQSNYRLGIGFLEGAEKWYLLNKTVPQNKIKVGVCDVWGNQWDREKCPIESTPVNTELSWVSPEYTISIPINKSNHFYTTFVYVEYTINDFVEQKDDFSQIFVRSICGDNLCETKPIKTLVFPKDTILLSIEPNYNAYETTEVLVSGGEQRVVHIEEPLKITTIKFKKESTFLDRIRLGQPKTWIEFLVIMSGSTVIGNIVWHWLYRGYKKISIKKRTNHQRVRKNKDKSKERISYP